MSKYKPLLVQLDGDPLDRKTEDGKFRASLNSAERAELKKRKTISDVIAMMISREVPDIAKELGQEAGQLATMMLYEGGDAARRAFIAKFLDKLLDLEVERSREQIAKELGIGRGQLNRLMETDEFRKLYSKRFEMIRSDPNVAIYRQAVVEDLLPKAYHVLKEELDAGTPWTVRAAARREVFKIAGVGASERIVDDRTEALDFLAKNNLTVNNNTINFSLPPEYAQAMQEIEVMDGEVLAPEQLASGLEEEADS